MQNTHTNHYAYLSEQIIELIMSNNQDFLNIFIEKILHILPRLANGSFTTHHDRPTQQNHHTSILIPL